MITLLTPMAAAGAGAALRVRVADAPWAAVAGTPVASQQQGTRVPAATPDVPDAALGAARTAFAVVAVPAPPPRGAPPV